MSTTTSPNLDAARLTPVVRAMLESSTAEVKSWESRLIIQGKASPANVYQITGTAQVLNGDGTTQMQDNCVTWSLVLKEVHTASQSAHAGNNASNEPTSRWYWKREMLLYQSGFFDSLPDGFTTPHCYRIDEEPDGSYIWMETVREDVGESWPLAHYEHVARHFGRFNGMFLVDQPLPTWPWLLSNDLGKGALNSSWPEFAQAYPALRRTDALVRRGWNDDLFAAFEHIWQDRAQFVHATTCLPQTLLHNDAGRKNLFARRRPNGEFETVVVDWQLAAIGPLGEELAPVVAQPVYWFNGVRPDQVWELDKLAFDGYVQGLRDVGWHGDAALARLGYLLGIVLRSGLGIFIVEWAAREEKTRIFIETAIGHPIEEISDVMYKFRSFIIACAEEARRLMTSLSIPRVP